MGSGYQFVLTARFTQDCVENLFSVVRLKKATPTPLEFKRTLKAISTAQFFRAPKSGSYELDDGELLAEFVDVHVPPPPPSASSADESENLPSAVQALWESVDCEVVADLPQSEKDALFYVAGYCVQAVNKQHTLCVDCLECVLASKNQSQHPSAVLTELKNYVPGSLLQVSDTVFSMFLFLEMQFRCVQNSILIGELSISDIICKFVLASVHFELPDCHNIKANLISKFVRARVHFFCKKKNDEIKKAKKEMVGCMGSKSMAMRLMANEKK